jgi:metal-sulfur cluster biosynthetic enzyme
MTIDIGTVWTSLHGILDPELDMSIVELGLVYGVEIRDAAVYITMTATSPGCPLAQSMSGWVSDAVSRVPGVERVEVRLTFDPPWSPGMVHPRGPSPRMTGVIPAPTPSVLP